MTDPRALHTEVRQLRRSLRHTRWSALGGVGLALLLGARQPTSIVRAERFELVNAEGAVVGVWSGEAPASGGPDRGPTVEAQELRPAPAVVPEDELQGPVKVTLRGGARFTRANVTCDEGVRLAEDFWDGQVLIQGVPKQGRCVMYFKGGGGAPSKFVVRGGQELECALQGQLMDCRAQGHTDVR